MLRGGEATPPIKITMRSVLVAGRNERIAFRVAHAFVPLFGAIDLFGRCFGTCETDDLVSCRQQIADDGETNVTGRAGDEYAHEILRDVRVRHHLYQPMDEQVGRSRNAHCVVGGVGGVAACSRPLVRGSNRGPRPWSRAQQACGAGSEAASVGGGAPDRRRRACNAWIGGRGARNGASARPEGRSRLARGAFAVA